MPQHRQRGRRQRNAAPLLPHEPAPRGGEIGRQRVERALPTLAQQRVEEHELPELFRHAVGDAGDDRAAEAVADQHHVLELLGLDEVRDVGDEDVERDDAGQVVARRAETGEGRREHSVARRAQPLGDDAPAPATMPGAVDEDEGVAHLCFTGGRLAI